MCHKTIIKFAPCGHKLPVTLRCEGIKASQDPCSPATEVDAPEESLDSEIHCPDCETDKDLKRLKLLLAQNPHDMDLQPTKPTYVQPEIPDNQKGWYVDDDDPVKALEAAMAANPELFAGENKVVDGFIDDDPLVALEKYLKEHPEDAQEAPTGYTFKYKELFMFCGHWGNFKQTDWGRYKDDPEWFDVMKEGQCPGCEVSIAKIGLDKHWALPKRTLSDDPYLEGRELGYIPQPFEHKAEFDFPKPPKKVVYPGNGNGGGSGVSRFETEAPPAEPPVPSMPTAVTPVTATDASDVHVERAGPPAFGPPGYEPPFEPPGHVEAVDMDQVYSELADTSASKGKGRNQSPGYEDDSAGQGSHPIDNHHDSSPYEGRGDGRADGWAFDGHHAQHDPDNGQYPSHQRSEHADDNNEAHGDQYARSDNGDVLDFNEQDDSRHERGRSTRRSEDWFNADDAPHPPVAKHGYAQAQHHDDNNYAQPPQYAPLQDNHYHDNNKHPEDPRNQVRSQTPSPEPHDRAPQDHTPSAAEPEDATEPTADTEYGTAPMPGAEGPDTTDWTDEDYLAEVERIEKMLGTPKDRVGNSIAPWYKRLPPKHQYRAVMDYRTASIQKKSGQIPVVPTGDVDE